eukprot:800073-Prymnesium_polylepis.1
MCNGQASRAATCVVRAAAGARGPARRHDAEKFENAGDAAPPPRLAASLPSRSYGRGCAKPAAVRRGGEHPLL